MPRDSFFVVEGLIFYKITEGFWAHFAKGNPGPFEMEVKGGDGAFYARLVGERRGPTMPTKSEAVLAALGCA